MRRDALRMRGEGATVFAQVNVGKGIDEISDLIVRSWRAASGAPAT
jgi:urease accessory protein